jgi:hypothetical protein
MKVLMYLSGQPVHDIDPLYLYEEDNSILGSHCGCGSFSLTSSKNHITLANVRLANKGVCVLFPSRPGIVTMANLVGRKGTYRMAVLEGEAIETAAHRELQEETGYDFGRFEKVYEYYPAISYSKERLIIYAAYDLIKKELPPDEDEFIEVKFFTLDKILELIKENKIMDGKTVLSILAYVTFIQKKGL